MIWGAISYARKTQPVHIPGNLSAARYWDEVLTPRMLPAMNLHRKVFQHANARPHTARATIDFLANQDETVLPCPLNHQFEPNRTFVVWLGSTRSQSSNSATNSARTAAGSWARLEENSARPYYRLMEAQQILTLKWRHLNVMDHNVIILTFEWTLESEQPVCQISE